jgi:hypothetical protein
VSRRARAIGFGLGALVCAILAAGIAGDYRGGVEEQLGELRPVLIARAEIEARRPLRPATARKLLEVRRVPDRFAPPDALAAPEETIGLEPVARIAAGSYVVASNLRPPGELRDAGQPRLAGGREPVEITVTGAEPLAGRGGKRVDVVVTSEPRAPGRGRTYVAAEKVELISLREGAASGDEPLPPSGAGVWLATLALTRSQALRLIQAENYAREVRLIASG